MGRRQLVLLVTAIALHAARRTRHTTFRIEATCFGASGDPAAITVTRAPGAAPQWGVSFSELVETSAAPARDTLGWYRLACFMPAALPDAAGTSESSGSSADRLAAAQDYGFVRDQLGACPRNRR